MVYLNKPELEKIKNEILEKPVLNINRDIFIFSCYTGLAYADVKNLKKNHFATTVTLANGVPIETVSKLLGHTKLSTTQIYARVLDQKIGDDMDLFQSKLA